MRFRFVLILTLPGPNDKDCRLLFDEHRRQCKTDLCDAAAVAAEVDDDARSIAHHVESSRKSFRHAGDEIREVEVANAIEFRFGR